MLMRKHYEHETDNCGQRLFKTTPKKLGPHTKLSSEDEILMTLMKLTLGLLVTHLSKRFGISDGLCTQVFYS